MRSAAALLGAWLACSAAASAADPGRGELIFNIGGCTSCHTAKGGPRLAGGDPLRTPFGTFHPPNITPDPETGIGGWSLADFTRAMREGLAPDGSPYYPSFPFTSYTRISDADIADLKAYLDTVPPVRQPSRPHELGFPYNQRWGLRLWRLAFFKSGRFEPDPGQSEIWNRGAYLVNGPGHCQECHTPRNAAGARDTSRAFAGADNPADPTGKEKIPNISGAKDGLADWSEDDITTALTLGMLPDGDFLGSEMAKVVENATSKLPREDVEAIATYLKNLPPTR
jgi:mono/diheme cytochrome c family protein